MKIAALHIGYHIMTRALQFLPSFSYISIESIYVGYKKRAKRTKNNVILSLKHDSALSKYQSPFAIQSDQSEFSIRICQCVWVVDMLVKSQQNIAITTKTRKFHMKMVKR